MGRADHLLLAWVVAVAVDASVMAASPCPADLDQSGAVTGIDLAMLLGNWGTCPPSPLGRGAGGEGCLADLDGNGVIDGLDLALLLGEWG